MTDKVDAKVFVTIGESDLHDVVDKNIKSCYVEPNMCESCEHFGCNAIDDEISEIPDTHEVFKVDHIQTPVCKTESRDNAIPELKKENRIELPVAETVYGFISVDAEFNIAGTETISTESTGTETTGTETTNIETTTCTERTGTETLQEISLNRSYETHQNNVRITTEELTSLEPKTNDQEKMEPRQRKLVNFEKEYRKELEKVTVCARFRTWVKRKCEKTSAKKILLSNLPFITTLRKYKRSNLVPDLIAGSTAGAMMIPQGMAFGALSTLPPIVGLYISLFAPLTYFFLGTCHQISMGCIAVLSLMMADILDLYDTSTKNAMVTNTDNMLYSSMSSLNSTSNLTSVVDPDIMSASIQAKRIEVAAAVTFVVGMITILLSKLGLGFLTCFMSNSLITSFTVGVSIHVLTSQLKNGLGLKLVRQTDWFKLPKTWYEVCSHLPETNVATLIMWVTCLIIIYLVKAQINDRFKKKMKIPIPIELFMVIFGTLASYYLELNKTYNVKIVEYIPKGVPVPKIPDLTLATDYIGDGILIAVVSYAQTVALAKTFGLMHKYEIDPDQEMFACGGANVICSLFSGYITAASVSRSMVVNGAGGKTQLTSLIACSIVLLVIIVLAPYFYCLPLCVLAAIICVNLRGMFWKLTQLNPLRQQSTTDFIVWMVTFSVTVFVDVIPGLLAGIAVSFLLIIIITQQSPVTLKGIIDGTDQSRSASNYHCVSLSPDIKILHINKPICFANSDIFVQKVFQYTNINPIKVHKRLKKATYVVGNINNSNNMANKDEMEATDNVELKTDDTNKVMLTMDTDISLPNYVILDISGVSFVDIMGANAIKLVITEFDSIGIKVLITDVAGDVYNTLDRVDFLSKYGDLLYLTLSDALLEIQRNNIRLNNVSEVQ